MTGDGPQGLEAALLAHAAAEGLTVDTETIRGGANGFIDRAGRRIAVGDQLDGAARCKTLAHELAHWHDLGADRSTVGEADRAAAEIVAEAVAFVVGNTAGLDTSDYSAGYVLEWARGNVDVLKAAAESIDRAARPILASLEREAVAA